MVQLKNRRQPQLRCEARHQGHLATIGRSWQHEQRVDDQRDQAEKQFETLKLDLSITNQTLDLALKENDALTLERQELENSVALQKEELAFFLVHIRERLREGVAPL